MISKIVDGCFFFLIFKICQKIWDKVFPDDALELLGNRFDHFEDLLYQLKEASQ